MLRENHVFKYEENVNIYPEVIQVLDDTVDFTNKLQTIPNRNGLEFSNSSGEWLVGREGIPSGYFKINDSMMFLFYDIKGSYAGYSYKTGQYPLGFTFFYLDRKKDKLWYCRRGNVVRLDCIGNLIDATGKDKPNIHINYRKDTFYNDGLLMKNINPASSFDAILVNRIRYHEYCGMAIVDIFVRNNIRAYLDTSLNGVYSFNLGFVDYD